ncbi:ABC transporter permease [Methanocella sp. CWC-04]|uniref:ABC transporter permease n=1 Tax=Methanooceanicella nereidis TaxID=2052831 RepID=A0AAP2RDT1_9EURY|nr:substrate-binding domain-containing protein [Methanocella sp. CWC-04]MCD1294347.1 ABC transporter permease [Methanocella sp. CWC-04]
MNLCKVCAGMILVIIILIMIPLSGITASSPKVLKLATTTSMYDTGLLGYLIPAFEKDNNVDVHVLSVGSGMALDMGRRGEVDVLIAHSPADEKTFMYQGYGKERKQFAHNYFVIVGPANDPAGIKGMSAPEAMKRIALKKSPFVSRGDRSGTHMMEMELWNKSGVTKPDSTSSWYMETGTGQAESLNTANEKQAYMLCDIGTFLNNHKYMNLVLLVDKDPMLVNNYDVITVNPTKNPFVNYDMAKKFADYLTSPDVQRKIGEYGKKEFGRPLFYPELEVEIAG